MFGLDSDHDYDPFWATCVRAGRCARRAQRALQQHRVTRSISSYVYNHIDGLAAAHESLCKSLFLGGVTRRFPELRVGFLEGGVAWACALFAGLVGHWEKRNRDAILDLDPDRLDVDALLALLRRLRRRRRHRAGSTTSARTSVGRPRGPRSSTSSRRSGSRRVEDLRDRFVPNFYFGCEADDPLVAWAFRDDVNPLGARLRPILGSDISHWDVRRHDRPRRRGVRARRARR